ncbi:MAG: pyridoxamine 5'-phosphate oxidase family protein [Thermoleophilia bacterium]|nr:pyridoxamine 5'-phosphate oxidase family protein [Thermoleophilia bacterium]
MDEQTKVIVEEILKQQRLAVLGTQSETGPYASLVTFWAADDLSHIVFPTMRSTRKFNYLVAHPRVSLLIDNRTHAGLPENEIVAVTATGTAREITDPNLLAAVRESFLEKHPGLRSFVAESGCALVKVVVDVYYVVTGFQTLSELHVAGISRTT